MKLNRTALRRMILSEMRRLSEASEDKTVDNKLISIIKKLKPHLMTGMKKFQLHLIRLVKGLSSDTELTMDDLGFTEDEKKAAIFFYTYNRQAIFVKEDIEGSGKSKNFFKQSSPEVKKAILSASASRGIPAVLSYLPDGGDESKDVSNQYDLGGSGYSAETPKIVTRGDQVKLYQAVSSKGTGGTYIRGVRSVYHKIDNKEYAGYMVQIEGINVILGIATSKRDQREDDFHSQGKFFKYFGG